MTDEFADYLKLLSHKSACGVGYVIIPSDVDRETYINNCFRTETVSIYPDVGGMSYNKVPVSRTVLQELEFPEEVGGLGSQVVFLFHPSQRSPIIIAAVSKTNELKDVGWKQFLLSKENGRDIVQIRGDARRGVIYCLVDSCESDGGQIMVRLLKRDGEGKLTVQVQGDIFIYSRDITSRCKNFTVGAQEDIKLGISGDDGSVVEMTKDLIEINGGENEGLVNAAAIRNMAKAILQDLTILGSGANLSQWMSLDMINAATNSSDNLNDSRITH